MPLLYRDAPLNSIWEGSGNVAALDVLRAMVKEPEGLPAFLEECELAAGRRRAARRPSGTRPRAGRQRVRRRGPAVRGAAGRRGPGARAPGLAARSPRPAGGRRRVLRDPARRARAAACTGRCPPGVDAERDHRARAPGLSGWRSVLYEVSGRVARLTLNRPERGNGITRALLDELERAVERADLDRGCT